MSQTQSPLRLIHITDPHLHADPAARMRGVLTNDTFRAVLAHIDSADFRADAILATGDLVQDESRAGYELFRAALAPLKIPVLTVPGNHDAPDIMQDVLNTPLFQVNGTYHAVGWTLIMLNSFAPGQVAGHLSVAELERLQSELSNHSGRHTLICLHHHPVPMGSRWLDGVALENPVELLTIIERAPQVRGLLWGHVHQASDRQQGDLRLISTPSTCAQFLPGSDDFALDTRPPAYRRLVLHPDGHIDSEVIWLD